MKQKFLLKTMLLLSALVAGSGTMLGTDKTIKVDFEGNAVPSGWTNSNMSVVSNPITGTSSTNGSYCISTGGVNNSSLTYNTLVKNVKSVSIQAARTSNNTNTSLYIDFSTKSDFSSNVTSQQCTNIDKNTWSTNTLTLAEATDGYVRVRWAGTTALKYIDNIVITYEESIVAISSIAFDAPKTASVDVGSTVTLTPTVLPAGYTETVDWVSDAMGVATVNSSGVVTGVAAGTAHITAKAHDNPSTIYDVCTVTVNNVDVTGVSLNKTSTTIEETKTETLTATIEPSNATDKTVSWASDATSVATVTSAGVVTGVAAGTANITVTTNDGSYTATCVVKVVKEKGSSIDAPFSVADVKNGDAAGKTDVYVIGYIVGSYNSTAPIKPGGSLVDTNFALADEAGETTGSKTIPVELTSGSGFRTSWGPASNTNNIDVAKVIIKGNGEKYFSTNAIKGTSTITKVAEAVKISDASGFATWASDSPLDFTGKNIDAYIAVTKGDGTGVTFTQINKVPANTGLLIHYSGAKTEEIPVFDGTGQESVTSNKFVKGTGTAVVSSDGTNYNYVLYNGGSGLGFYRANGKTVAKNKAYISVQEAPAAVKEFIALPGFEDDADGLETVQDIQEVQGAIYNLAGQRLNKMQKGINIVNGKKILY